MNTSYLIPTDRIFAEIDELTLHYMQPQGSIARLAPVSGPQLEHQPVDLIYIDDGRGSPYLHNTNSLIWITSTWVYIVYLPSVQNSIRFHSLPTHWIKYSYPSCSAFILFLEPRISSLVSSHSLLTIRSLLRPDIPFVTFFVSFQSHSSFLLMILLLNSVSFLISISIYPTPSIFFYFAADIPSSFSIITSSFTPPWSTKYKYYYHYNINYSCDNN